MKTLKQVQHLVTAQISLLVLKMISIIRDKNNDINILISLCSLLSTYWFLFYVYYTSEYTFSSAAEAIFTLLFIGGMGVYILVKKRTGDDLRTLTLVYSGILISIGMIDGLMDMGYINNSNFSNEVLISSIICELFYIVVGVILSFNE